jgi:ubiquinone/menaquinone biosynthesis C-methylase UbiE
MLSGRDGTLMNEGATVRFDFGRVASRYDAWYWTPRGAMYDRLEKRAIDSLLPSSSDGGRLLEIGCGTGHFSEHFAGRGFDVTGVDISEPMIAMAQQKNVKNSRFEVADAEHLPFADETFDVAAAITVLEFVSDPARVVSEMVRCTRKPGGMLIFGVLNRLSAYNQRRKHRTASLHASANLFSPDELRDLLQPFGAATVRVAGFVPRKYTFIWLSPLLEWIGRLTGDQHGAFLAARVRL